MKKRPWPKPLANRTKVLAVFAGFLIILLLPVGSVTQLHSQQESDLSEYQKRLTQLSQQIKALQAQIKKEEKRQETILSRLERIGFNKRLIRKEISVYNIRLDQANQELTSLKEQIPPLQTKLAKEKQSIEKILVTLYKFGRFNTVQFMLQARDFKSVITESKNLGLLAQYQEKIVTDYMITLNQLQTTEAELEAKKEEISQLIQNAQQKKRELEAEERKNRDLINEIARSQKTHLKTLEELNERSEQLQELVKKLLKKEISLPFALVPLYEKKGNLPWPMEGKIITQFGLQRHPRFNTVTVNNGIEIAPDKNDLIVKSIHPGKVVYTDHFQGYGNLIIVDHGLNYYSLYGQCSDFLVGKGDYVETAQPIALIGDFSSTKGISLYFEIRFKTKPLDPLRWLKRR